MTERTRAFPLFLPRWGGRFRQMGRSFAAVLRPDRSKLLARALDSEMSAIARETRLPLEEVRQSLGLDWTTVDELSYPDLFARARLFRLQTVAEAKGAGTDGMGVDEVLPFLAIRDLQNGREPAAARSAVEHIAQTAMSPPRRSSEILEEVGHYWRGDASSAVEQMEVQDLIRLLLTGLLLFFFGSLWISRAAAGLVDLPAETRLLELLMAPILGLRASVSELPFLAGFFGVLGAAVSVWQENGFRPGACHWRFVRRANRLTLCLGGFAVGLLVSTFLPILFPELVQPASPDEAASYKESHIYLTAFVGGLSQGAFFDRLRSLGGR